MEDNNNNNNICSSTSSSVYHNQLPCCSDEISHFLRQILVRSSSSSSSSTSTMAHHHVDPQQRSSFLKDGISAIESSVGVNGIDGGGGGGGGYLLSGPYLSGNVRGCAATSSLGASENETDEYDCESEEGFEALVDEAPAKAAPPRGSSKRSRAAEVHNLSEKRRRSRINEKMKALQNLIPNSNKTDKASMLDEAIEYLKQLQLQVQMLSMRNGLSLHPMCLPGVLQPIQLSQMRMGFGEENGSLQINMTGTLPQETSTQAVFSLPNQCSASNQLSVPNMSNIINSETSFGMESSIHAHFGPFQLHTSAEEICREDILPHQQLNVNHSEMNPSARNQEEMHSLMTSR